MQINLDQNRGVFYIRSYLPGEIRINDRILTQSVILTNEELIETWEPQSFADLKQKHLESLLYNSPEIVLLGTGAKQHFVPHQWLDIFYQAKIGFEMMETSAACRTYNVLMSEDRKVTAGFLIR